MLAPSAGASPHDCGASSDFLADEGRKAPWGSALLGLGAGCTCCCQDAAVRQRFSEDLQREHACQLGSSEVREGGLGEGGVLLLLLFHTEHLWVFLVPHTGNCLSGRFNHACWFWGVHQPNQYNHCGFTGSVSAERLRDDGAVQADQQSNGKGVIRDDDVDDAFVPFLLHVASSCQL